MKKAIVFGLALLVAGTSAYATTIGRDGTGGPGAPGFPYADLRAESDVLVGQWRENNTGFGNLIPFYSAALTAAGANVSTYEAASGASFPAGWNVTAFPVTFILTSDNWWSPNFPPVAESAGTAYLNNGGKIFFSGQDYLYGRGYPDGNLTGFPLALGAGSCLQDTPFGADFMDVLGMNILDGVYMYLNATLVFTANPFYPDTLNPRAGAAVVLQQVTPVNAPGAVIYDSGTYKSIFTSLEIAGDETGQFAGVINTSYWWLRGQPPVSSETTTVGAVKASYR